MSFNFNGFEETKYLKWKEKRRLKKQKNHKQIIGALEELGKAIDFELDREETEMAMKEDLEGVDSDNEVSDSGESSDSEEQLNDCPTKPITMSRTVWARIDEELHPDLSKLYERYLLDQRLASAIFNSDIEKDIAKIKKCVGLMADRSTEADNMDEFEKCKKIIKRCALYEQIANERDVEAKELGLVEAADGAWGQLPETNFYLFEELFEICRRPNEAEFDLLGRVLQTDPAEIQQWFEWKNQRYQFSNLLDALNSEAGPRVEAFLRKTLQENRYQPRPDRNASSGNEGEEIDDSWEHPEDYI